MDEPEALRRPVGWWLKEADRGLDGAFDAALGPSGVGRREWQVLSSLGRGGLSRAELHASLASFDPAPVLDGVVDGLLARGWVHEPAGVLALTAAGREQEQALAPVVGAVRGAVAAALPQEDYAQLVSLLARLVTGVGRAPSRPPVQQAGPADGDADRRTMRQRMLAGDLYVAEDPDLAEEHAAAVDLTSAYNATTARQGPLRRALLEQLLGAVGEGTVLRPPLQVDYGRHISIGARTFANTGLVALDVAPITIGDDVQIGPGVQLLTPTHPLEPGPRRAKWEAARPIVLGDNVWLGGGVIVLAGVTIGADTVVGAGAVVTRDLPAGVVAVGAPARVVRGVDGSAPPGGPA